MDQQLLFLINCSWASPWLDRLMAAVSSFDLWVPFLILAIVLLAIFGGFRWRAMLLVAGVAVGISDGLIIEPLKSLVGRPRPHEMLEGVRTLDLAKAKPRFLALGKPLKEEYSVARINPPHGNSFPSGHASNNFAVAAVTVVFFRRWGWLMYLPATLVAYSRIYVGSHWPFDILISCLIGTGVGFLTVAMAELAWKKWAGRWREKHPDLLGA